MIARIIQHPVSQGILSRTTLVGTRLLPAMLRRGLFGLALAASVLAAVYWGLIASDRYVSEAQVIVQRTDLSAGASMDFSSLLSGAGVGNRSDQLLLRNYLLSPDMLDKLDARLDLRAHYADRNRDPFSRMWSTSLSKEWFHQHYLSRVSVELDEYSGVLVIKAQGYDPKMARAITAMLVEEGERMMNEMAHKLARDQVAFVEKQVAEMAERFHRTRQVVLEYQNRKGMVAPEKMAETLAGAINALEAQRTELQTRRTALLGYLSPTAPGVVELDMQIGAIDKQLKLEQSRLAAPKGKTLNSTVEEYQRLVMEAKFAEDVYRTSLVALEKGRVEATRNLKKVSTLQSPTLPEYALEPRRIYNIIVFILVTLLIAGVAHLLAAIIRDHKD